jgi:hypothetical protein
VFRAQADGTFNLPSELPTNELRHLPSKVPPEANQTSQYVVPRGGIFLGKWRSSFIGSSDCKMNVPSACALNILYEREAVRGAPRDADNSNEQPSIGSARRIRNGLDVTESHRTNWSGGNVLAEWSTRISAGASAVVIEVYQMFS